jgi:hypothetical protein
MTDSTVVVRFKIPHPQPRRTPQADSADAKANGSSAASTGETNAPTARAARHRVSRVARMLALAWRIEAMVENNEVKDHASVARLLGVSRARIAQVTGLALLSPSIQERLLDGSLRLSERQLRRLACDPVWSRQEEALAEMLRGREGPSSAHCPTA